MTYRSDSRLAGYLSRGDLEKARECISRLESKGEPEQALLGRILVAERIRDAAELERVLELAETMGAFHDPALLAEISAAARWTLGLGRARAIFRWASHELSHSDPPGATVCSFLAASRHALRMPEMEPCPAPRAEPFLPGFSVPAVAISINNLPAAPFIVDSGAPNTLLSESFCKRVGLPRLRSRRTVCDGSGHAFELSPVPVGDLVVAGTRISGIVADAAPVQFPLDVSGIFSPCDLLPGAAIELDFAGHSLRVLSEDAARRWETEVRQPVHRAPLMWDDGNMFVRARAGAGSGWFLFDSGASSTLVTRRFAKEIGPLSRFTAPTYTLTAAGRARLFGSCQAEVAIGTERPRALTLVVRGERAPANRAVPLRCAGWLGVPWMEGRRILLDLGGRHIRYTDP